jgi:hypothetical protein
MFHVYREYYRYDQVFLVWIEIDLFEMHHRLRSLRIFVLLDLQNQGLYERLVYIS